MSEPSPPLVVSGPSGSGKSALLANWLLHYRRRIGRRPKHGGPLEEPFIFCHAVGQVSTRKTCAQLLRLWDVVGRLEFFAVAGSFSHSRTNTKPVDGGTALLSHRQLVFRCYPIVVANRRSPRFVHNVSGIPPGALDTVSTLISCCGGC